MRIIKKPKINIYKNRGKHCFITEIDGDVYRVFDAVPVDDFEESKFHWGDYPSENKPYHGWCGLREATIIQNICWIHGLAPRVYEIVGIEIDKLNFNEGMNSSSVKRTNEYYNNSKTKKYFAQRIEYLDLPFVKNHTDAYITYNRVIKLGEKFGFHTEKGDVSFKDVLGDKLVDFNTFHFEDHTNKIKAIIREKGRYGKTIYQREPKLDIVSTARDTEHRIKAMKLDEIDFKGKSVMDLGCATGAFCRYARDRGAKVLGIDFEDVIGSDTRLAAYLISWELGYFDIEFEQMDLRVEKPEPAQIVLFFSMSFHIGIPDWLGEVTKETLIFEENSKGFKEDPQVTKDTIIKLKTMFRKVELIGYSRDREPQHIFRCTK